MQNPNEKKEAVVYDHTGVPIEALESLRLRLTQLTHSLNKLQSDVKSAQLPHWVSLQSQFNIILTQLASLSSTLSDYAEILEKTVVYPLPQFPTTEQEGLLTTLLRKKALPEVVEWIDSSKQKSHDILLKDDEELTKWALDLTIQLKDDYNFQGFTTKQEQLNGVDEASDLDLTNSSVSNSHVKPKLNLNDVLKFMYQGTLP